MKDEILIAGAKKKLLDEISSNLTKNSINHQQAFNEKEALKLITKHQESLKMVIIVQDKEVGKFNGVFLALQLRHFKPWVKTLFVSQVENENLDKALEMIGCHRNFSCPIDFDKMILPAIKEFI